MLSSRYSGEMSLSFFAVLQFAQLVVSLTRDCGGFVASLLRWARRDGHWRERRRIEPPIWLPPSAERRRA